MANLFIPCLSQKVGEVVLSLMVNYDKHRDFCPGLYLFSHLSQKSPNNIDHLEVALSHSYHYVGLPESAEVAVFFKSL